MPGKSVLISGRNGDSCSIDYGKKGTNENAHEYYEYFACVCEVACDRQFRFLTCLLNATG
jgi:hypothetical protein